MHGSVMCTAWAQQGLIRPQSAISPPEFADAPIAKLILYTNLEVIHHGAEIALLRDLYLWKNGPDAPEPMHA